jgi:hypothetical protein
MAGTRLFVTFCTHFSSCLLLFTTILLLDNNITYYKKAHTVEHPHRSENVKYDRIRIKPNDTPQILPPNPCAHRDL